MSKTSVRVGNIMNYSFWLVFSRDGSMRFARTEPAISPDERAMRCSAALPLSLFRTPQLSAKIEIAEGEPAVFEIDVKAAGEALSATIGCAVELTVREPDHV